MDNFDSVMDLCIRALNEIPDTVRAADVGSLPPIFGPDASDMVSLGTVYAARFFRCAETTLEYETNESGQLKSGGVHEPLAAEPAMQEALFGVKKKYKRPTETVIRKYAAMTAEKFSAALVDIITDKGRGALDAESILWRCLYAGVIYLQVRECLYRQKSTFAEVLQSTAINALAVINTATPEIDNVTGKGKVTILDTVFEIDNYSGKVSTSAQILNDIFLAECQRTRSASISIPLVDLAEKKGRSTSKPSLDKLRKETVKQMDELRSISYTGHSKVNGKEVYNGKIALNGGTAVIVGGEVHWNYNQDCYKDVTVMAPMDYPRELWKVDPRTNQFYFGRYIAENYRKNDGKRGGDRIKIRTLISKTPNLPTYEQVMRSDRRVKDRIIEKTFHDLDALDNFTYTVHTADGQVVERPESMDYNTFISGSIEIDYSEYPAHPDRVNAKQRRKKHADEEAKRRQAKKAAEKGTQK